MNLKEYQDRAARTDRTGTDEKTSQTIKMLGMAGELGSYLSEIKKSMRDGDSYTGYLKNVREELGDMLWYVARMASAQNIDLQSSLASKGNEHAEEGLPAARYIKLLEQVQLLTSSISENKMGADLEAAFANLVGTVIEICECDDISFESILQHNIDKTEKTWLDRPSNQARVFDEDHEDYEKLPRRLKIEFLQVRRGNSTEVLQRMNGIIIGDRLTDNSYDADGYRYHDAFHLAYAATLGWSPVVRRMLRVKRKSIGKVDEVEDGARAAIIEEAISFTVFNYAREHSWLEGLNRVDQSLLKHIRQMVDGLEVEKCSSWEWQQAILKGYEVFRELRDNSGGWVYLDADTRQYSFSIDEPI